MTGVSTTILEHSTGRAFIEELPGNQRRIRVEPSEATSFIPYEVCETSYPIDLIRKILNVKDVDYLCDEVLRDEDPTYIQPHIEVSLLSYLSNSAFEDKRILDFGCGSGASISILARMFPKSEIVGVELLSSYLSVARARVEYYGFPNVSLYSSPSGTEVPRDIGRFDFIMMSAVFEHLLPQERKTLMPKIWSLLKEDGLQFITQTPNRLFPIEKHTTGLPLLNYAPKWIALEAARRIQVGPAKRYKKDDSWEYLLREGIRGATENEILSLLRGDCSYYPIVMNPSAPGLQDSIDVWYLLSAQHGKTKAKSLMKRIYKAIKNVSNINLLPDLTLAIKKSSREKPSRKVGE
jgi:2-polyprenyl-3-methyl-5-hydroxy-6-metoxy-1,4-benzoquinol methylase